MRWTWLGLVAVAACGDNVRPGFDASWSDASGVDGVIVDGSFDGATDAAIDVAILDAPVIDAAVPDAPAPVIDAAVPDAPAPVIDAAVPDAPAPVIDAAVPDAPPIDAVVPDAPVFDAAPDAAPLTCSPANVRVTNDTGASTDPVLTWSGTGHGVAWTDTRDGNSEIYFALLDPAGTKVGSDIRVTNDPATSEGVSAVYNGAGYGISWYDNRDGNYEIYFARLDEAGAKIGADVRVTNQTATQWGPSLVWDGAGYGVAWWDSRDGNYEIYFARLDAAGVKIGADVRVTNDSGYSAGPSLTWTGIEYAMAWQDDRAGNDEVYFTRMDASGVEIGSDVRITNATGTSGLTSLVWNGTGFGLGWEDTRFGDQENFFARLDSAGVTIGSDVRLTARLFTPWNLVWTGTEYGLGWTDNRDGNLEIYFGRLDASGAPVGADLRLTNDPALSRAVSLVWTGTLYAVAWGDLRDGNWEVYFSHACP